MKPINISEKLALFSSHWDPHVVSDYNDNDVMVVKFKGNTHFTSMRPRTISSTSSRVK